MSQFTKSLFVSLDGLDGTGKSTQCKLLAERLRGRGLAVTSCVDPGATELGTRIRELLLHGRVSLMTMRTEALLFMASRAELVAQIIAPALTRNEIVICDRYLLANVVYQGHAGGLDVTDLWRIGQFATGGIEPDLTIVLDLPVELAKARRTGSGDRVEARDDGYFQRVRDGFLLEAARRPDCFQVVDASLSTEDVQDRIYAAVVEQMNQRSAAPRG